MRRLSVFFYLSMFFVLLLSNSCKKEDDKEAQETGIYSQGIFITNEGTFGKGNGSVSYFDPETGKCVNDIFMLANSRPLGDVVQSMYIHNDKAYIVVNVSGKVEIVKRADFTSTGVIESLQSPRYFLAANDNKAYISCWGEDGNIAVIDLKTNKITSKIKVGYGPEEMLISGNYLYVCNGGGYGSDNKISIINIQTDELENTIETADNPTSIVSDAEGDIWVLCRGAIFYNPDYSISSETPSKLIEIDANSKTIKNTLEISKTLHASHLSISPDKKTLYFGGGFGVLGIFSCPTSAGSISQTAFISNSFYSFAADPESGIIYGLSAPSFETAGKLLRYNNSGTLLDSTIVGIAPNGVVF